MIDKGKKVLLTSLLSLSLLLSLGGCNIEDKDDTTLEDESILLHWSRLGIPRCSL